MSNPIETQVEQLFADNHLQVVAVLVGATKRDDWECDAWKISIKSVPGVAHVKEETFDFYTGVGHRKVPKHVRKPYYITDTRGIARWEKENAKPVAPHIASVLYSLVLDGMALDINFSDWCEEFGYSDDSMKAVQLYKECCDGAKKLQKLLGISLYKTVAEAVQDY